MKKNSSLKTKILISISVIICAFAILIVGYQNYASRNLAINNAHFSLNRQSEPLIARITDYMQDADREIKSVSVGISGDFIHKFHENSEKIFKEISQIQKISNMLVSLDPTTFIFLSSLSKEGKNKETYLGEHFVQGARFIFGIVQFDHASKIIEKNITFYDENGKNLGNIQPADAVVEEYLKNVQTKVSAQVKGSGKKIVDASLISKKPVLVDIRTFGEHGYVYSEIGLSTLSLYLDSSRISEKTRVFLINDQKQVVADSILEQNPTLTSIESESMKLLKRSYDEMIETQKHDPKNNYVSFSYEKIPYTAFVKPFPTITGLNWKIMATSPLSDLTIETDQIEMNSIIFAFVLLLVILFWIFFYINKYSQPINYLGIEANKIRNFDLEDSINIESDVKEIVQLTTEIENMKTSVKNFSHFIPKGLLEKLVGNNKDIEIGGKVLPVTLFFSDIANFTTISEGMTPNALFLHLSEYLEELTGVISQNQGTIDKYIGDSIMAFWGAPEPDEDQVLHACRVALICQQKLDGLNRYWKQQNKPELFTRIGIHTGEAVVGNMGSSERINYTALGDTVNLAARLEGANKMYGSKILVSEAVVRKLGYDFIVKPVDIVAVKGKAQGIKVFELVGKEGDSYLYPVSKEKKEFVKQFTAAFDLYITRKWQEAIDAFESIASEDQLAVKYADRCREFLASPPPEDWDGVIHLHEK